MSKSNITAKAQGLILSDSAPESKSGINFAGCSARFSSFSLRGSQSFSDDLFPDSPLLVSQLFSQDEVCISGVSQFFQSFTLLVVSCIFGEVSLFCCVGFSIGCCGVLLPCSFSVFDVNPLK